MVIATSNDRLAFAHWAEHRYRAQGMEIEFFNSHLNKTSSLQLAGLAVCPQVFTLKLAEGLDYWIWNFFPPKS